MYAISVCILALPRILQTVVSVGAAGLWWKLNAEFWERQFLYHVNLQVSQINSGKERIVVLSSPVAFDWNQRFAGNCHTLKESCHALKQVWSLIDKWKGKISSARLVKFLITHNQGLLSSLFFTWWKTSSCSQTCWEVVKNLSAFLAICAWSH